MYCNIIIKVKEYISCIQSIATYVSLLFKNTDPFPRWRMYCSPESTSCHSNSGMKELTLTFHQPVT